MKGEDKVNLEKLFDSKLDNIHTKLDAITKSFDRIEKKINEDTVHRPDCDRKVMQLQYYIIASVAFYCVLLGIDIFNIKLPFGG